MVNDAENSAGPLAGLQVVEMAGLGPAPLAGQLLADLGAQVTVIDKAVAERDPADINRRNKRSIALNLKRRCARAIALKLVGQADVLIEGFRPGVMERLGLGPDDCHAENAGLIFARMTGWGQTGPRASTAGHDINYLGVTGALHAVGEAGRGPVPPLNLAADYGGGTMFLLFGVFAALWERSQSGRGQVVDAAMVDGVPAMMGLFHQMLAGGDWSMSRGENLLDGGAPFYRCYKTSDDLYLSVGPLEPAFYAEFVSRLGLDASTLPAQYDRLCWPEMHARFGEIIAGKTRAEWEAVFAGSDACVAPVLDFDAAAHEPHSIERGAWIDLEGVRQAAPAPRFSRTPPEKPRPPSAPGADAHTILTELGFEKETVQELIADGAVLLGT